MAQDDCVLLWMNADGAPALTVAVAHWHSSAVMVLWPGVSRYVMDGMVGSGAGRCVSRVDWTFGMVGSAARMSMPLSSCAPVLRWSAAMMGGASTW
eukprot:1795156-Rhodomonas_salina.1